MPLIPVLWKQREVDFCESSLVYIRDGGEFEQNSRTFIYNINVVMKQIILYDSGLGVWLSW